MEKVELPIKTKIAAWWMVIIGGITIIWAIWSFVTTFPAVIGGMQWLLIGESALIFSILFIPGIFILKRKKWGWWIGRILLWVGIITLCFFYVFAPPPIRYFYYFWPILIPGIIIGVSLILLEFDRKNFWKIAT